LGFPVKITGWIGPWITPLRGQDGWRNILLLWF